jgi:GntR family transcriptional regulator of abcA and norABC
MASSGANFWGLDIDEDGLVIDKLRQRVRAPKNAFMHLHASNQNPTGVTTSATRRREIYELCNKWDIPIIEMDSMRGMYHIHEDPLPIKAIDTRGLVIYIGSFLRPTSEVLGLAWIVADEHIINTITRLKQVADVHPNLFGQCVADSVLRNGLFYKYQQELRQHLAQQLEQINEAMQHYIGDIATWNTTQSSYYLWPEFEGINTKKLYHHRAMVDFNPGFFYDPKDHSHISITTLCMESKHFDMAFSNLRTLINKTK